MRKTIEQRLLDRTTENEDSCWICNYSGPGGYSYINIRGSQMYCHRVAYELWVRHIPKGLHICHSCDVKACINPEHLWSGTPADNMRDRDKKGRHAYSKETREKISKAAAGRKHSEETKAKMSKSSKGVLKSEAHKEALKRAWIIRRKP
jgi:hypothetical protein